MCSVFYYKNIFLKKRDPDSKEKPYFHRPRVHFSVCIWQKCPNIREYSSYVGNAYWMPIVGEQVFCWVFEIFTNFDSKVTRKSA